MKTYPPRKHDKSKRVNRSDWPKFVLHSGSVQMPIKPYRYRKGCTTIIRPE